jgi:dTDP-4-amino-4,6-dideoxygalactose transaminase
VKQHSDDLFSRLSSTRLEKRGYILHAENVLARRYFFPGVHRMEPYCSRDPRAFTRLLATDAVLQRVLVLPSGATVGPAEIEIICSILCDAVADASDLCCRLPATLPLPTAPLAFE